MLRAENACVNFLVHTSYQRAPITRCAKGIFAKGILEGTEFFPFSGWKAPQNSPVAQVSGSLLAGGLYLADAL